MPHSVGICSALLAAMALAEQAVASEEYLDSWSQLLRTYGMGRWTISVNHRGQTQDTIVFLVRWPLVRVEVETSQHRSGNGSPHGTVRRFVYVYTPDVRFAAEQVAGRYVLTTWSAEHSGKSDVELWRAYAGASPRLAPVIRGYLPFVPLVFYGSPLPEVLSDNGPWQVERWERRPSAAGEQVIATLVQHRPRPGTLRLTLRLDPPHHWLVKGWEWYVEPHVEQTRACELRYDYERTIDGVPMPSWGRLHVPAQDLILWEARLLSFEPTLPPESAFRPEALGIPRPRLGHRPERLWLWALLGVLGLLTALLVARVCALRSGRKGAG